MKKIILVFLIIIFTISCAKKEVLEQMEISKFVKIVKQDNALTAFFTGGEKEEPITKKELNLNEFINKKIIIYGETNKTKNKQLELNKAKNKLAKLESKATAYFKKLFLSESAPSAKEEKEMNDLGAQTTEQQNLVNSLMPTEHAGILKSNNNKIIIYWTTSSFTKKVKYFSSLEQNASIKILDTIDIYKYKKENLKKFNIPEFLVK